MKVDWQAVWTALVSFAIAAVTATAFAFTTFQTKENSETLYELLIKRLDRIEDKVDLIPKKRSR